MRSLLTALVPPAAVRAAKSAKVRGDQDQASPPAGRRRRRARLRDWAELLRVSALFTVPGDALAGAAATGLRPGRSTAYAVGASLCLYEAGMALNDWADRDEDAVERPHRPVPSGRISPAAALGAAGLLTAAGLTLAARAGRPALAVASALAATVWAYDLRLKHTPAAPAAMATARALDLVLGATATMSAPRGQRKPETGHPPVTHRAKLVSLAASQGPDLPLTTSQGPAPRHTVTPAPAIRVATSAATLAAHTYAVTAVSRHEAYGGSARAPLAALGATATLGLSLARARPTASPTACPLAVLAATAYARTSALTYLHAALNPSAPLTQRAVGGGIRAMIPLQAALAARSDARLTPLALLGLAPVARALARKVSPT